MQEESLASFHILFSFNTGRLPRLYRLMKRSFITTTTLHYAATTTDDDSSMMVVERSLPNAMAMPPEDGLKVR